MFGDVCWSNGSSVLWLRRSELPSAVVGLRYPMETAHNCSFAVASDSGALIVVVRLLDLRRESNGTCLDHVTLEEGPGGRPLIFEGPRCSSKKGDVMHALVRGVVHVSLSVTPPVERVYRGLNIAFTTYFHGECPRTLPLYTNLHEHVRRKRGRLLLRAHVMSDSASFCSVS
ncbi:hypothetical protein HPB52_016530 [Rhipicephalus sanguineus]|uniref:Uncharacterized protein n=1 Tax=Rhipicephalus sanguineus TaxID=34632 RepID=A0A9D4Q162_RHISA|nr:hypothetical protein HPB52_016530 [Rhipicephalus sanguineus]